MIIDNHYIAIKSLSRLLASENSKQKGREHFCTICLQGFHQKIPRDEHMSYCLDNKSVKVEMPHKKTDSRILWWTISIQSFFYNVR